MEILLAALVFVLIVAGCGLGYSLLRKSDSRSLTSAAKKYTSTLAGKEDVDILYYRKFSNIPTFNAILSVTPGVHRLDELLQQAGVKMLAGIFILASLTFGAIVNLVVSLFFFKSAVSIGSGCLAVMLPYMVMLAKRAKRRRHFEELFPDALDLMAYSLKAGHSIMASLKMVAEEIAQPVAEEFGRAVEEINFGRGIEVVLRNMARRIDSAEVRYFATAVIIQRETGGNLVAILEKTSEIIRKKFRFRERVKALSAEGKISAMILVALPNLVAIAIFTLNPEYISVLVDDPVGPYIVTIAVAMMSFGSFVMYRLVQLDM